MPSNLLSIDSDFPSFTGEESPQQQIRALHDYLFQLRQGLQYSLRNLTAENFNSAALKELTDEQSNAVVEELKKLQNLISDVSGNLERLTSRVAAVEGYGSRLGAAEIEIDLLETAIGVFESWKKETDIWIGELKTAVRTEKDGVVVLGKEGSVLKLVGSVYVNDILLEIKDEETGGTEEENPGGAEGEDPGDTGGEDTGGTDSEVT